MPITKELTTPNGVPVTFHRAKTATANLETGDLAAVEVASWVCAQHCADGLPFVWMWHVSLPASSLWDIDTALAAVEPFTGATPQAVPDPTPPTPPAPEPPPAPPG